MLPFYTLILSSILFSIGISCILIHKNLLFILIGIEIISNASMLSIISATSYWNNIDGIIFYIIVITISAVDSSICLALFVLLNKIKHKIDVNKISEMKG